MPEDESDLTRTTRWLVKRFGTYYKGARLHLPARYTRREWAFLFFDRSFMMRHLGFERRSQVEDYIRSHVPRHAYYSTAYYEMPSGRTMDEKGWQGATLIFDLDADHIKGAQEMEYGQMLDAVKRELKKLVNVWLFKKLGFDEQSIRIVFSGGRGYHVHIDDPRVLEMNAYERREIIDLITGKANLDGFLEDVVFHSGVRKDGKGYSSRSFQLPDPGIGDWRGDLAKATINFFKSLDIMMQDSMREEAATALQELTGRDLDRSIEFVGLLEEPDDAGNRRIDRLFKERRLDFQEGLGPKFWKTMAEQLFVRMAGEADEPVTADTKRLIRLPTSLHGKTGFRVVELSLEGLDDFDPLVDALAFGDEPVEVEAHRDETFDLGGSTHVLDEGKRSTLPEHAAVFAMLRGMAKLAAD